jgi:hypothetical protein
LSSFGAGFWGTRSFRRPIACDEGIAMSVSDQDGIEQDSTDYEDQDAEPTTMAPAGEGPTDPEVIAEAQQDGGSGPTDLT